uniref:Predicted protein n=1 Tax=Hordeum vulgare subsp. vulgare TaxID=112509 RepID=F2DY45_HORVV|nr:predicted protein [Hordeum vulgare subsp. vulgare]
MIGEALRRGRSLKPGWAWARQKISGVVKVLERPTTVATSCFLASLAGGAEIFSGAASFCGCWGRWAHLHIPAYVRPDFDLVGPQRTQVYLSNFVFLAGQLNALCKLDCCHANTIISSGYFFVTG